MVKDHLGREFVNMNQMCKHYNIHRKVFTARINNGWSLADSLMTPVRPMQKTVYNISDTKRIIDHFGCEHETIADMCNYHGISVNTFYNRRKRGLSVEDSLKKKCVTDHTGNEFNSIKEMCAYYGTDESNFRKRIKRGYSVKEALTYVPVYDHLNNEYKTYKDMFAHYNISYTTFSYRKSRGLSLEECLTGKKKANNR